MNWITLYIKGREGFKDELDRRLMSSDLKIMPGYENMLSSDDSAMYWIDESIPLRKVKEAIGGKLVWKYRLQFYCQPHAIPEKKSDQDASLSDTEKELVKSMRKRMKNVA